MKHSLKIAIAVAVGVMGALTTYLIVRFVKEPQEENEIQPEQTPDESKNIPTRSIPMPVVTADNGSDNSDIDDSNNTSMEPDQKDSKKTVNPTDRKPIQKKDTNKKS